MNLRPYQEEAVGNTFDAWRRGKRSVLYVCPTGGGKSLVFAEVIRRHLLKSLKRCRVRRALVLADRRWLVEQARDCIAVHVGIAVGLEMGGQKLDRAALPPVVCASVQSVSRSLESFETGAFDLVVVDEADLALAPTYRRILDYFPLARVFGCTATPERGDGLALGEVFEEVVGDVDIRDLIDVGYLCQVRQRSVRVLDLSRVRDGSDGDFDEADLERVLMEERHLHEVVEPVLAQAEDRPTIVFGVTVHHARALAALFDRYRAGSARAVSGWDSRAVQRQLVRDHEARRFQFLCNCVLVGRGVDVPYVSCVAMARPTRSRTLYVQGIGRGTRTAPGKDDLLVLDFTPGVDDFSLVSAVDALGGRASPEERERAREILDEEPGGSVTGALDQAVEDLKDAAVRARVRARVRVRTREVSIRDPIDWRAQRLGEVTDAEVAEALGVTVATVECARHRLGIRMGTREVPAGVVSDRDVAEALGVSTRTR